MALDDNTTRRVLDSVAEQLRQIPMENSPPETAREVYRIIREVSGNSDPYKSIKQESTERALALYPVFRQMADESEDPLAAAIKIAAAGNVIDYGVKSSHAIEEEADRIMENDFAVFDLRNFLDRLQKAERVLYIGDNAGECVFDRVLIETMNKPVTYVVRGYPVINDATEEDAKAAGIERIAEIISSDTDAPGTVLSTCSAEFLELFENQHLIISKGQGNYEALSGQKKPIFFILKAKCSVIASDLNVREGQMIFKGVPV